MFAGDGRDPGKLRRPLSGRAEMPLLQRLPVLTHNNVPQWAQPVRVLQAQLLPALLEGSSPGLQEPLSGELGGTRSVPLQERTL